MRCILIKILFFITGLLFVTCKKDNTQYGSVTPDNYTDFYDFVSKNEVKTQTYTINATTGGNFTTSQGTNVTIPPNAFVTQSGSPVSGSVTIEFKDIYKKSDMLLSNIPTRTISGNTLKSGGEFWIKASSNNMPVFIKSGEKIEIRQPFHLTGGMDTAQEAFIGQFENSTIPTGWFASPVDSIGIPMSGVALEANNYVYSLYQFGGSTASSGTWSNSDNSSFFSTYPQTTLTLAPTDNPSDYGTECFLVFKTITSMVHLYRNGATYPYTGAPQGLQCTIVAVGFKDGDLYSSFVPITIGTNQNVSFTLNKTTTSVFKSQLQALN